MDNRRFPESNEKKRWQDWQSYFQDARTSSSTVVLPSYYSVKMWSRNGLGWLWWCLLCTWRPHATTEIRSKVHFIGFGEGVGPYFAEASGSRLARIDSDGWQFAKERFRSFKWATELYLDPYDELPCAYFYAMDRTPELTLKAIIKIPSSMVHSSGVVKSPDEERVPFRHLLDQSDFKDVTLKVGNREFRCHRVILANKWGNPKIATVTTF